MTAGSGSAVVRRSSLREQIAGALREEMMAGRLAAGTRFTVKEIAELYGVSATPAREALVDLTAQGLLRVEHHRGFAVPALDWQDFLDIVEARTLLADNVFRHLGRRPTGIAWDRLPSVRRRAEAATRAARAGQLDVLVGCDRRFWREAGGLLGNPRISDYLDLLRVQSWMYAAPRLRGRPDLVRTCWDGHVELVDRIAERDRAGAHRMVLAYNRAAVELMARLDGHEVPGLLPDGPDAPAAPPPAAPASAPASVPRQSAPGGGPAPGDRSAPGGWSPEPG
ncbi:GntR family transcriptional regulator [Streptomyces sp. NPDC001380]|uniref:GntR family transcriptional regulator n=1 Tax=Streptomyces sp. NPDC001380 TaxID=3364566 RepID=UPI0036B3B735